MRCDVLIAGAGPAGCAAAIAARRAAPHLSVVLVDAARFPREKPCAGAITGGGLRELERAGLALRVPHAVVSHARLRALGREARVELPRPAVVVRRAELDADLVQQARDAGATVLEGAALEDVQEDRARTGAGEISFGALVCADGAAGPSRRLLGLGPGRHALLREARAPGASQWDLLFDLDAGVPGYAWRFPAPGLAGATGETVGIYAHARTAGLGPALEAWLAREGRSAGEPVRWPIRLHEPRGPVGQALGPGLGKTRALLAGEALGVDPLTGEGIRYAFWSGRIAGALAARAAARRQAPSLAEYRARLAASRSGLALALLSRLAGGLYGPDVRWRRLAAEPRVAAAFAAVVSGRPSRPVVAALAALARIGARTPSR
jgi:flavin-dependent dehydrogenase